jgi:EpsI family protein
VVGVHIAYYRGQGEGRKLVSSTNRLVPMRNDEWNLLPSDGRDVTAGRRTVRVNTAEVRALAPLSVERRPHLMVWQFYWIDGRFIAGDAAAKIAGGLSRLQGHGDEGASVVLYADGATVAESNATLEAFLEANLDRLNAVLQRTHDTR